LLLSVAMLTGRMPPLATVSTISSSSGATRNDDLLAVGNEPCVTSAPAGRLRRTQVGAGELSPIQPCEHLQKRSLNAQERHSNVAFSDDIKPLSRFIDKDSKITIDLSRFESLCGFFFASPYSLVATTTDEAAIAPSANSTDKKPDPSASRHKPVLL
jgi:hypothetical protein